ARVRQPPWQAKGKACHRPHNAACGKCLHIGLPGIQPSDDTAPKPSRKCKQILRSHRDYAILSDQQVETRGWGVAADKSVFRDHSCAIEPQDIKVGYHEDLAVKHGDIL